jgi:RNA polymerase sigma factor (sigma-70 family)
VNATSSRPSTSHLILLTSVISDVANRHRLNQEDRQDFSQSVHLRLAERDYDIFVRFGGRSSLRTFLTVVVSRLLLDWRNHHYGKWRPSAKARRRGEWAIALERLVFRDGYSLAEATNRLCNRPDAPGPETLRDLFAELPLRSRRVFSALPNDFPDSRIQDYVEVHEQQRRRRQASVAVARALRALPATDRRLIVLRYFRGQSVRSIAEMSKVDPKMLYRRMERVMRSLRGSVAESLAAACPD